MISARHAANAQALLAETYPEIAKALQPAFDQLKTRSAQWTPERMQEALQYGVLHGLLAQQDVDSMMEKMK